MAKKISAEKAQNMMFSVFREMINYQGAFFWSTHKDGISLNLTLKIPGSPHGIPRQLFDAVEEWWRNLEP
jgi:Cu2+-containing amine oxidase